MQRLFLFFLLAVSFWNVNAQVYTIPWATVQPSWVFPIYFEDNIGQKDTIYIGYHKDATSGFLQKEKKFGEKSVAKFDSVNMQAYTYLNANDSVYKVQVADTHLFRSGCICSFTSVFISNAYFPLTVSWDVQTFYSDSLPFSPNGNLPRGQCIIDWYFGGIIPPSVCPGLSGGEYILITDSVSMPGQFCWQKDSTILRNQITWMPTWGWLEFAFNKWYGWTPHLNAIPERGETQNVILVPNPASTSIYFENFDYNAIKITAQAFAMDGTFVLSQTNLNINNQEVNISQLPNGIYIVKLCYGNPEVVAYRKLVVSR